MTIKVGTEYIHMALGYQDAQGAIVVTEDTGLATMTGRYADNLPTASTDPDAYTWTELADPAEADDTEEDTSEGVEDTSSMLYRMAGTQMTEAIQDNLAVGTNQGASGWATSTGTIAAASCQPDGSAEAVNGVAWTATAGGTLLRTEHIPGEAVPETVTVSFWWLASAACGLTVSIGNNESETQYNHDSTDLDEDGNALDLTDAWLFFRALIPIAQTADDYAVRVATDSAATISICDFKVEPGDKVTAWTESAKAAMSAAQTADSKAQQADSKAQAADDKAQAAGEKATAADEKAQAAGATAQAVQTALNGLTKIQDGQVLIDGDKVYLSAAFVRSIFAQDITATGTITGAQLIGAILSGNAIDIQAVIDATSIGLKTELVDNSYCLVLSTAAGTTKSNITLSRGSLKLVGQSLLSLDTQELAVNANSIQFTVAEGSYCPYYKAGDRLSGKWKGGGYVTTAKKEVVFTVPLCKPIVGNPTITVAASLIIRQASKYTHGSASSTKVTPKSYEVERGIGDAICITCVMSDLTNATNNDACAVSADLTITFS